MRQTTRRTFLAAPLAATAATAPPARRSAAQPAPRDSSAFPNRVIRVIVPFAPGGGTDVMMRLVAQSLSARFSQQVVVDNVAGAGGTIGAMQVVNAAPDGHTLLCGTPGSVSINPVLRSTVRYRPLRDLAPVAQLTDSPIVLVANKDFPAESVPDLIRMARAAPGSINFGSAGPGSIEHLSGELFNSLARVEMVHVPYRGTAQSLTDLRAGRIHLLFENLPPVLDLIRSGGAKALAVGTAERSDFLPHLPTIAEAGVPGYVSSSYMGLLAPARTPPEIIWRLSEACAAALREPELAGKLRELGAAVVGTGPEAFRAFIAERTATLERLVEASDLRLD